MAYEELFSPYPMSYQVEPNPSFVFNQTWVFCVDSGVWFVPTRIGSIETV